MRVHHLNCGTMTPRVVGRLEAHVLLCESDDGLVLVDSGFGLDDIADPAGRLGPVRHLLQAALDPTETAAHQVNALGFDVADVQHIVLTHLDLDHVGGISDFPDAVIHTTAAEHRAAMVSPGLREKQRYRPAQWAHGPMMHTYDGPGEPWHGFA
ncbi:MAG: MBL fold metallo-hydrolase, partial [Jatrophihabitans sp.]